MSNCCHVSVSRCHSVLVAVTGVLLGVFGMALVGIGARWDSNVPDKLYTVVEKITYSRGQYYYNSYTEDNSVLLYEGFMVFIPMVPAVLQLCRRVRSSVILFLLSLTISFAGSITAAVCSGLSWKAVAIIYAAKEDDKCYIANSYCSCSLPGDASINRTANLQITDCDKIDFLHSTINAYFAISIITVLLTTAGGYVGCMVSCAPGEEKPYEERHPAPPAYGAVYPTTSNMEPGPSVDAGASNTRLEIPGASAPVDPRKGRDREWAEQNQPLLSTA